MTLPFMFNLIVGDWSHDGHSMTETITVLCNLPKEALEGAYKVGSKQVGFDLADEVCADYEDMSMPDDIAEKLKAAGIDPDLFAKGEGDNRSFSYDCEAFAKLWLSIARLGDPSLKFEMTTESPDINIGGYGLLGS